MYLTIGVSGFPFPRNGNPLGFLASDVPMHGFEVPMNPEPIVEFTLPGTVTRT